MSEIADHDAHWMARALDLARHAESAEGEVPVGAVIVLDGKLVGEGWNRNIAASDPTAHAEVLALRDAGRRLGNYRFPGAELYVTLEPCAMCAMALLHARVKRVVYGARDPKAGAAGSVIDVFASAALNHHTRVEGGLLADDSGAVLRSFFAERREQFRQRRAGSVTTLPETDFSVEPIPAGESLEINPKGER